MKIKHFSNHLSQDIGFLTEQINAETPHYGKSYPFAFLIKTLNDEIIAGCNDSVIFGIIYTDQL